MASHDSETHELAMHCTFQPSVSERAKRAKPHYPESFQKYVEKKHKELLEEERVRNQPVDEDNVNGSDDREVSYVPSRAKKVPDFVKKAKHRLSKGTRPHAIVKNEQNFYRLFPLPRSSQKPQCQNTAVRPMQRASLAVFICFLAQVFYFVFMKFFQLITYEIKKGSASSSSSSSRASAADRAPASSGSSSSRASGAAQPAPSAEQRSTSLDAPERPEKPWTVRPQGNRIASVGGPRVGEDMV